MDHQKVSHLDWTADLAREFQPSIDASPWGTETPAEVLNGAHVFEYLNQHERALIAVRPVTRAAGLRLDVVGLVSTGDRLSMKTFDAALLEIAAQFNASQLAMTTLRPHVARQAGRTGWIQSGIVMIRPIDKAIQ